MISVNHTHMIIVEMLILIHIKTQNKGGLPTCNTILLNVTYSI